MSSKFRGTSPRRDVREAKSFTATADTEHLPMDTPAHPDAPQPRTAARGPAYAQEIYERRMARTNSPNTFGGYAGEGPSADAAGATPSARNTNNGSSYYAGSNATPTANNYYTPSRSAAGGVNNFSTAGTVGGGYTPSHTIVTERQQIPRGSPIAVNATPLSNTHMNNSHTATTGVNNFNSSATGIVRSSNNASTSVNSISSPSAGNNGALVNTTTHPHLANLALTAPDKAMLEMLVSECQDRHFVEKLFVAQEEKHERNQWLMIEAHRRRMLQMSYAAPVRIARMEAAQEQRVGELIAEYEIGEEIMTQRRKMDERVGELRSVIDTTNRYRDALEELENDHKAKYDREMADLEDDRRAKKRLLDELSRQYEFASIHNRTDDLYSGSYGIRAAAEYQRLTRRDPDHLKSPNVGGPRALETITEQSSPTGNAIRSALPTSFGAAIGGFPASSTTSASPATAGRYPTNAAILAAAAATPIGNCNNAATSSNYTSPNNNNANNYAAMTNFSQPPQQQQQQQRASSVAASAISGYDNGMSAPAAPLYEPTATAVNNNTNTTSSVARMSPTPIAANNSAHPPQRTYSNVSANNNAGNNPSTMDIVAQSQRALARAEELERSATQRSTF